MRSIVLTNFLQVLIKFCKLHLTNQKRKILLDLSYYLTGLRHPRILTYRQHLKHEYYLDFLTTISVLSKMRNIKTVKIRYYYSVRALRIHKEKFWSRLHLKILQISLSCIQIELAKWILKEIFQGISSRCGRVSSRPASTRSPRHSKSRSGEVKGIDRLQGFCR